MKTSLSVEITVEIERPAAEVWAVVSDFTRLPSGWTSSSRSFRRVTVRSARATVFRYTLKGDRSALIENVAWEPGRRVAWDGPPLAVADRRRQAARLLEVTELAAGRTRFVSRYEPELSGLLCCCDRRSRDGSENNGQPTRST